MQPKDPKQPPPAAPQPAPDVGATEFLVREVVHGEQQAAAWGALSAKCLHYLQTRFGHSSFPQGVEFGDFVSDAMIKILTSIESFEYRGKDSFWKWVQTVAGNLWRDLWRRHERDRRLGLLARGDAGAGEDRPPALTDIAPSAEQSPTQIVRFRELERAEQQCVAKLAKHARDVYLMRRQQDLSFAEISEQLGGIKEATLRSHYMRARDQIRECLGRQIDELAKQIQGWQD
ncbi:MAG: sigma-70 family RNA polymerase sigma factor [Planctomycetes bacterium]|nr:sigma-70 family RNA polymerase sigma factor [Planctomycetota bacterium]